MWKVGLTVEIKLRFCDGLASVDGRPNGRNKAPFSNNSFGVKWAVLLLYVTALGNVCLTYLL